MRKLLIWPLSSWLAVGCVAGVADGDKNEHAEMSYEAILDPVIDQLRVDPRFGPAVGFAYDGVTAFARTDFAERACVDSPDDWGLEVSFGGDIGVGYMQGLEFALEEGAINMNCLNQLSVEAEAGVSGKVNLIRHVGECHAQEGLEDTLFLELGVGASPGAGVDVGLAYTAGLSRGLLNRAVPTALGARLRNYREVVQALSQRRPVFQPMQDPQLQDDVCAAVDNLRDAAILRGDQRSPIIGRFLDGYLRSNARCGNTPAEPAGHDEEEPWTACSQLTIKNAVQVSLSWVTRAKDAASNPAIRLALGEVETFLILLDNIFSGCDHIEFQLSVGAFVASPVSPSIGLESHNAYGRLAFNGTDAELGRALAGAMIARDPGDVSIWTRWFQSGVCELFRWHPQLATLFPFLPVEALCTIADVSRASVGIVRALYNDPRFGFTRTQSLNVYGFDFPLPDNPLLNYTLACGIGPVRNLLETLWSSGEPRRAQIRLGALGCFGGLSAVG